MAKWEVRTAFAGPVVKVIPLHYANIWVDFSCVQLELPEGADSLYFTYRGPGSASFKGFNTRERTETMGRKASKIFLCGAGGSFLLFLLQA